MGLYIVEYGDGSRCVVLSGRKPMCTPGVGPPPTTYACVAGCVGDVAIGVGTGLVVVGTAVAVGKFLGGLYDSLFKDQFGIFSKQDKRLSPGEIKRLKDNDIDIHELKEGMGRGKDLFKDKDGRVIIKNADGSGEGVPTGININDFK